MSKSLAPTVSPDDKFWSVLHLDFILMSEVKCMLIDILVMSLGKVKGHVEGHPSLQNLEALKWGGVE